eukprot:17732-Heterococcus_DN1.PRE.2
MVAASRLMTVSAAAVLACSQAFAPPASSTARPVDSTVHVHFRGHESSMQQLRFERLITCSTCCSNAAVKRARAAVCSEATTIML